MDGGLPVRDAYLTVIQPALYEVGSRWERGELTVAQEHLATATVQALIARLSARLGAESEPGDRAVVARTPAEPGERAVVAGTPAGPGGRPVVGRTPGAPRGRAVVACTPGELHAVGARFVADFLEGDGWEVLALGPSTPHAALVDLVRTTAPRVVALSTTLQSNLSQAGAVFADLSALRPRPLLVAGGAAYAGREHVARTLGADVHAGDAESLRDHLRVEVPG